MTDKPNQLAYRRVLLKMSGAALIGQSDSGLDPKVVDTIAADIKEIVSLGVEVGMVVGGGNLFRGHTLSAAGIGRITGDYIGMLATLMNALAIRDALERANIETHVLSAIAMNGIVDTYDRRKAIRYLSEKKVVIFAAGTGNPLVTTDSAASLRAIEVNADILLKATQVDGVYSADPAVDKKAVLYKQLSYQDVLSKELGVMDLSAFTQSRDHHLPIRVFNMTTPGILKRIVLGADEGTLVSDLASTQE